MKNNIAFLFISAPHGTSGGREGLDAVLATSAITSNIGLFFVSDGVLQLTQGQLPKKILARNYIATFGLLTLYNIKHCYICAASLKTRGIPLDTERILVADVLESNLLREKLHLFNKIITF